ncbi:hypothetical protein [Geminicoccus harenae]|uniref:hypothetical protein n=1 Tax=Geminicoccus harenae TaxID=2498453 RepID=UPI00168BC850|nr:hypothetical protein [Geminicoccus harenae]
MLHQEIGTSDVALLKWVLVRDGHETVLVELGMPLAGQSQTAVWHDPIRKEPGGRGIGRPSVIVDQHGRQRRQGPPGSQLGAGLAEPEEGDRCSIDLAATG